MKKKALFLDLDGTIIETKSGKTFPVDLDDWKFKKGILEKIRDYYIDNYMIIIITNQAGVSDGYMKPNECLNKIREIGSNITNFISRETSYKIKMIKIYHFASFTKDSKYRKPRPDRAIELAEEFDLDLSQSIMVGDGSGIMRQISGKLTNKEKGQVNELLSTRHMAFQTRYLSEREDGIFVKGDWNRNKLEITFHKQDFSDSDKKFAENAGIGIYYDIDEFLKLETNV